MKIYEYASPSSIEKVEFRQGISGAEAIVFPGDRPHPSIANLPDTLRKQGMNADPIVSGNRPALRVRGFSDESQIVNSIATSGLGTPVNTLAQESGFAAKITAERTGESAQRGR